MGAALIAQAMDRRESAAGAGAGSAASTGTMSLPGSPEFAAESRALDTRSLGYRFVKRTFDIAFSACVCVVGLIPGAVLCAFIAADTKGAPIYAHERAGRFGRPIRVLKFRSMVADANDVEKYLSPEQIEEWHRERKVTNDPRITKLGRVLRKTSLDELPQFFNVLKGDMSLVGPRPEVPYHVEHFKEEIPRYLVRQQVRPGCTGWAQIHGLRGDTDIAERIRYDIWYIENWTVALDIKIIFRTVFGGKMVNDEKLQ